MYRLLILATLAGCAPSLPPPPRITAEQRVQQMLAPCQAFPLGSAQHTNCVSAMAEAYSAYADRVAASAAAEDAAQHRTSNFQAAMDRINRQVQPRRFQGFTCTQNGAFTNCF